MRAILTILAVLTISIASFGQSAQKVINFSQIIRYTENAEKHLVEVGRDTLDVTVVLHPAVQDKVYLMYNDTSFVFTDVEYIKYDIEAITFSCNDKEGDEVVITIFHSESMLLLIDKKGIYTFEKFNLNQ